jgi:flotillin
MLEFSTLIVPIVILIIILGFIIALMMLSRNYIKVSPNSAAVISGRRRKLADGAVVGYRLVRGGATLVVPFLEKVEFLNLNVLTVPLNYDARIHGARRARFR